jgi:hypothetical protein
MSSRTQAKHRSPTFMGRTVGESLKDDRNAALVEATSTIGLDAAAQMAALSLGGVIPVVSSAYSAVGVAINVKTVANLTQALRDPSLSPEDRQKLQHDRQAACAFALGYGVGVAVPGVSSLTSVGVLAKASAAPKTQARHRKTRDTFGE